MRSKINYFLDLTPCYLIERYQHLWWEIEGILVDSREG